jgi:hypothetical protein
MAIYRYNFTDEFKQSIKYFSTKHKDDSFVDFKIYFERWCDEYKTQIEDEYKILLRNGYEGDVMDKIFKSARYYFVKKSNSKKPEKKERKKYTCKNSKFLKLVKDHINNIKEDHMKPSEAYNNFAEKHGVIIEDFVKSLISDDTYDKKAAKAKVKKIYKNKYFVLTRKNTN